MHAWKYHVFLIHVFECVYVLPTLRRKALSMKGPLGTQLACYPSGTNRTAFSELRSSGRLRLGRLY